MTRVERFAAPRVCDVAKSGRRANRQVAPGLDAIPGESPPPPPTSKPKKNIQIRGMMGAAWANLSSPCV